MLQKPNLTFVTSATLIFKVMTPYQTGFRRGLWGSYIPGFNLMTVIRFELSCRNGSLTDFDLCDLCHLENQGHDAKTIRLPQGPMGKMYTRIEVDSCDTFRVEVVSSDRRTDRQHHNIICPILRWAYKDIQKETSSMMITDYNQKYCRD